MRAVAIALSVAPGKVIFMSSSLTDLQGVIDAAAALVAPAPGELTDADAIAWTRAVEQLGRHVDVLRVRAAGDLAERSRRELGSASLARRYSTQTAAQLIEKVTRVSSAEAARRVRLAADTAPRVSLVGEQLPARFDVLAAAFRIGEVGMDAALTIARNLGSAERRASFEQLEAAELELVADALEKSADLVGIGARAWRTALDPDGAEPRDAELRAQRRLMIGRERADGMTPFWGEADPASAAQLRAWLAERTAPDRQPRFLADDDPAPADAEPEVRDPRTREQRTFDAFMGLLLAGVRAEAEITTAKHGAANVMVVMTDKVYSAGTGTAWVSDVDEPISAASAATIACDSGIQRVYLAPNGEPLALGRRERYFTAAQRKAMAVRDGGGCAWPGCCAPVSWTHAHHPTPWSEGGETDVGNGVLLCAFHHRLVHEGEWQIMMREGIPYLRAPLRLDLDRRWVRMGRRRLAMAA